MFSMNASSAGRIEKKPKLYMTVILEFAILVSDFISFTLFYSVAFGGMLKVILSPKRHHVLNWSA